MYRVSINPISWETQEIENPDCHGVTEKYYKNYSDLLRAIDMLKNITEKDYSDLSHAVDVAADLIRIADDSLEKIFEYKPDGLSDPYYPNEIDRLHAGMSIVRDSLKKIVHELAEREKVETYEERAFSSACLISAFRNLDIARFDSHNPCDFNRDKVKMCCADGILWLKRAVIGLRDDIYLASRVRNE